MSRAKDDGLRDAAPHATCATCQPRKRDAMAYAVEPTTQASQTSHSYSPGLLPEHRPERAVVFGRSSGFVSEDEPVTEPNRQRNKKRAVSCDRKRSLESTFGYIEDPCQESAASFEHERSTKLPANLECDQRAESALASGNMADTRTGQTLPVESLLASGYGTECKMPSSSERKHCKSFATETDDSPAPCTIEDHAVVFSHRTALQIAIGVRPFDSMVSKERISDIGVA